MTQNTIEMFIDSNQVTLTTDLNSSSVQVAVKNAKVYVSS